MDLFELMKTSSFTKTIKLLKRIDFDNSIYYYGIEYDDEGNEKRGLFKINGFEKNSEEDEEDNENEDDEKDNEEDNEDEQESQIEKNEQNLQKDDDSGGESLEQENLKQENEDKLVVNKQEEEEKLVNGKPKSSLSTELIAVYYDPEINNIDDKNYLYVYRDNKGNVINTYEYEFFNDEEVIKITMPIAEGKYKVFNRIYAYIDIEDFVVVKDYPWKLYEINNKRNFPYIGCKFMYKLDLERLGVTVIDKNGNKIRFEQKEETIRMIELIAENGGIIQGYKTAKTLGEEYGTIQYRRNLIKENMDEIKENRKERERKNIYRDWGNDRYRLHVTNNKHPLICIRKCLKVRTHKEVENDSKYIGTGRSKKVNCNDIDRMMQEIIDFEM